MLYKRRTSLPIIVFIFKSIIKMYYEIIILIIISIIITLGIINQYTSDKCYKYYARCDNNIKSAL